MQAENYNLRTCKNACSCLYFSKYFKVWMFSCIIEMTVHRKQVSLTTVCFFKSRKNAFSSWSKLFILCYAFCYMTNASFTSDYIINKIWTKLDKVNRGAQNFWITSTLLNSMLRGNVPVWIRHCVIGEKTNVTERGKLGWNLRNWYRFSPLP